MCYGITLSALFVDVDVGLALDEACNILGGLLAVAIGFLMIPVLSGKKQKETVAEDSLAHSK